MSIESKNNGFFSGQNMIGYRVRVRSVKNIGIDPKPGFSNGPGKRRGIRIAESYMGTGLEEHEARNRAKEINKQKGIKSIFPWERATVVKDIVSY
jgi:hypothetical protein